MFMRPTAARVRENAHQELPRQPHSLGLTLGAWQRTHGSRCSQHGLWLLAVGLPRSSAPHSALGQPNPDLNSWPKIGAEGCMLHASPLPFRFHPLSYCSHESLTHQTAAFKERFFSWWLWSLCVCVWVKIVIFFLL